MSNILNELKHVTKKMNELDEEYDAKKAQLSLEYKAKETPLNKKFWALKEEIIPIIHDYHKCYFENYYGCKYLGFFAYEFWKNVYTIDMIFGDFRFYCDEDYPFYELERGEIKEFLNTGIPVTTEYNSDDLENLAKKLQQKIESLINKEIM